MKTKIIKSVVHIIIIALCCFLIVTLVKNATLQKQYLDTFANESASPAWQEHLAPYNIAYGLAIAGIIVSCFIILLHIFFLMLLYVPSLKKKLQEKYEKNESARLAKKEERDAKRDERKNQEKLDRIARLEKELQELKEND